MVDFDDFDWEDATTFAGIAGFIEESLREENRKDPSEAPEDEEFDDFRNEEEFISTKRKLQMLAARDPEFARYVIKKAREQSEQWALQAQARRLISAADKAYKLQEEEDQRHRAEVVQKVDVGGNGPFPFSPKYFENDFIRLNFDHAKLIIL